MQKQERVLEVVGLLRKENPHPKTELKYENEMQFAVAVMLSAQTTDKKVNELTKNLFNKYKTWQDFANADLDTLTGEIRGVNFHKGKAQRLIQAGKVVQQNLAGRLPQNLADLVKIPGVARKSANVIQQELWGVVEGVVVDTHVSRVSARLGFTIETDPVKIEKDLMVAVPKEHWQFFSQAVVLHGRYTCTARKPRCAECVLSEICPSAFRS